VGGEHDYGGRVTGFSETRGGGGEEGEREEKRCRAPLFIDHPMGANAVILRGSGGVIFGHCMAFESFATMAVGPL